MRNLVAVVMSAAALGACTQDEASSNSERDTHMGEIRGAEAPTATPTATAIATPTPKPSAPAARPSASASH